MPSALAKGLEKVFLYAMNAVISESTVPDIQAPDLRPLQADLGTLRGLAVISKSRVPIIQTQDRDLAKGQVQQWFELIPHIQAEVHDSTKRLMQQWFDWMDGILAVHRSSFVLREPTPALLTQHKTALKLALEYCHLINTLIDDPGFNEPGLVSRLQVRTRQLQDAYDTFHDTTLSDAQAEEVLKQIFPE